jgi:hypothetical protein
MQCCGYRSEWIQINFGWLDPDLGGQKMANKSEEILSFEVLSELRKKNNFSCHIKS